MYVSARLVQVVFHTGAPSPVNGSGRRTPRARSPSPSSVDKGGESKVPFWERLSYDARMTKELRDELLAQEQRELCRTVKHQGHANKYDRRVAGQKPIWQRLMSHQKDYAALDAMREVTELQGCTFSPNISKSSARTTPRQDEGEAHVPVWERFHARPNRAERSERLAALKGGGGKIMKSANMRRKSVSRREHDRIVERLHSQKLGNVRRRLGK